MWVGWSAEAVDELACGEDLDRELCWIDREEIVVAGDERGRVMGGRERDEIVILGVAADGRVWGRRVGEQGGLAGEVGDESERFVCRELFAQAGSGEDARDLPQQHW